MIQYPHNTTLVLTDNIFLTYGGQTGTSTPAMRDAMYRLAEEQMTEYLQAFLVPTTVTGTHFWRGNNHLSLDYGYLLSVKSVTITSVDASNSCQVNTASGCWAVRGDGRYGQIDVVRLLSCAGCGSIVSPPYNITVSYESGLSTGTVTQPAILQALTLAAQINLNEIDTALSNESTGDGGIEFFINQHYHEKRRKNPDTAFGNSAIAGRIARLVRKYRARPSIGFRY